MRAREWKGVAGMEEGKPGESLTLGAEGARPSVAAGAAGEELDFLATPPKTQPPAPAPHRAHPAPRSRSGSPAGTRRPPRDPRHFAPRFASEERGGGGVGGGRESALGPSPHTHRSVLVPLHWGPPARLSFSSWEAQQGCGASPGSAPGEQAEMEFWGRGEEVAVLGSGG